MTDLASRPLRLGVLGAAALWWLVLGELVRPSPLR